jgi:hypothetical protein
MPYIDTPEHSRVARRRYTLWGRPCQDCGRTSKPATTITFWASGYRYRVCGDCIRAYRRMILTPCSCER